MESINSRFSRKTQEKISAAAAITLLLVIGLPFLIIIAPILITVAFVEESVVRLRVRRGWIPRGKYIFIVYSSTPRHKERVEEEYLPRFGNSAIVMNWSDRKKWTRMHTELDLNIAGRYFDLDIRRLDTTGKRTARFNMATPLPGVIVFRPWYAPKVYRLGDAFRENRCGNPDELNRLEIEMFESAEGRDS